MGADSSVLIQVTPSDWVLSDSEYATFCSLLGADEQQRLARLRPRKQREFLISRALLRYLLSHLLSHVSGQRLSPREWHIEERMDLPPRVVQAEEAGLHFSISHSAGVVAVAISSHTSMGIDIEYRRTRDYLGLAQTAFHPAECDLLAGVPVERLPQAFYRAWTLGEAALKSQLLGLSSGMASRLRMSGVEGEFTDMRRLSGIFTERGDWSLALVSPRLETVCLIEAIPGAAVEQLGEQLQVSDVDWEKVSILMPRG